MSDIVWSWIPVIDGVVGVVAEKDHILRVYYLAEKDLLLERVVVDYPNAENRPNALLSSALTQLSEYFAGRRTEFDLPLSLHALSPFSRAVHQALRRIPYGGVVSYAELAERAGAPRAARAIGRVMADNPFPIIIPCHRVVRADGRIGEYSGGHGAETKRRLIEDERRIRHAHATR